MKTYEFGLANDSVLFDSKEFTSEADGVEWATGRGGRYTVNVVVKHDGESKTVIHTANYGNTFVVSTDGWGGEEEMSAYQFVAYLCSL